MIFGNDATGQLRLRSWPQSHTDIKHMFRGDERRRSVPAVADYFYNLVHVRLRSSQVKAPHAVKAQDCLLLRFV